MLLRALLLASVVRCSQGQTVLYWGALRMKDNSGVFCLDAASNSPTNYGTQSTINGCSLYTGSGGNGNQYHVRPSEGAAFCLSSLFLELHFRVLPRSGMASSLRHDCAATHSLQAWALRSDTSIQSLVNGQCIDNGGNLIKTWGCLANNNCQQVRLCRQPRLGLCWTLIPACRHCSGPSFRCLALGLESRFSGRVAAIPMPTAWTPAEAPEGPRQTALSPGAF